MKKETLRNKSIAQKKAFSNIIIIIISYCTHNIFYLYINVYYL